MKYLFVFRSLVFAVVRCLFAMSILLLAPACSQEKANKSILDVSDFQSSDSRTAGIQEAIDALPMEGGVVYLPPGNYEVSRAIHLRSRVYIRGEGDHTVVSRRYSPFQSALSQAALIGEATLHVVDSSGFRLGDEVCVRSKESHGWWSAHTLILEIADDALLLADALKHDYLPEEEALALNLFPTFYANDAQDIRIENLCIDGQISDEDREQLPVEFTLSAVHFRDVSDCLLARVNVRNYPGDGISIQMGDNATIRECLAEYNLGHGFHPGTGLTSSAWVNNIGRFNDWDGLFFCHRVRHSIMSGNRLHHNGWNGIGNLGVGGEGGDRYNVVTGNFCYNNAKSGIECTGGGNNTVTNNVCQNNSQYEPGRWPGILVEDTHSSIISGNRCLDFQEPESNKTQAHGILVIGESRDNVITGNLISGHPLEGIAGEALGRNLVEHNLVKKEHQPPGI